MTAAATSNYLGSTWLQAAEVIRFTIDFGQHQIRAASKRLEARWEARARQAIAVRAAREADLAR